MGNSASRVAGTIAKEAPAAAAAAASAAAPRAAEAGAAAGAAAASAAASTSRRGAPPTTDSEAAALSRFVTRAGGVRDAEAEAARRAKEELAAIHARVNKRIGLFRRLDEPEPGTEAPDSEWDPAHRAASSDKANSVVRGGKGAAAAEEEEALSAAALARRARLSLAAATPRALPATSSSSGDGADDAAQSARAAHSGVAREQQQEGAGAALDPWTAASPSSSSSSLAAPGPATRKSLAALAALREAAKAERDAAEAAAIDWSAIDTKPTDPAAAEVAEAVLAQATAAAAAAAAAAVESGASSGRGAPAPPPAVSVRRIRSSSDAALGLSFLHEKSEATVNHVASAEAELGEVIARPADDAGTRNFALYEAMQLNPLLLDTPEVLARSPVHMVAAQLAAGILPPLALPASARGSGSGEAESEGALVPAPSSPSSSLVAAAEAVTTALAPLNASVDELLLRGTAMPTGVAEWGPRPPEVSPYDQLILAPLDAQYALNRSEIFELYARARADPVKWTPAALAALYGTKEEWVEVLLAHAAPPTLCQVDGEPYGVYEVRALDQHPAGRNNSGSGGTLA